MLDQAHIPAVERLAPRIHGVLRFFDRVLRSCRSCDRRAARGATAAPARGELIAARRALAWLSLAHRALRLAFKRRCWAHLGVHLRDIKEAGKAA